ncbi:MAG: 6-carboxytetrahydropterin synthase [Gemmatimonadetes bacterium]|nr:6-carboxytetrahydropterin synthase [Gemmatimonadota bacterium]NNK49038.1 6-carboxytetrahydropterin synthase [Gemmatimonadota bacterium]
MTDFRVAVGKDVLVFAAAHFITYGDGGCEPLHGHNYRVGVTLEGDLDRHSLVYDFIALRRDMEKLLAELDHRVILPEFNQEFHLASSGDEVEVRHRDRRYVFPVADAVILPIANTTAENIAEYLGRRLAKDLRTADCGPLERLQIEVEESPGQSAFWAGSLEI